MTAGAAERLRRHLREPQHRDAYLLMANTGLAAAAGLAFWLVLTRGLDLPAADVGLGYATVAVGTTIGVMAKGGLDAALLGRVPRAGRTAGRRLLALATGIGGLTALLVTAALALAAGSGQALAPLTGGAWLAAGAIGVLLVSTWLQDAYFLAERDARTTLVRTAAASVVRIGLPILLVAWAAPSPVAVAWAAALAVSAAVGLLFLRRIPQRTGRDASVPEFLASSARNLPSSASEFLPGLLLAPIVLALRGPEAAAHFGMAWTVASLLFLVAGAVGRSALAQMARSSSDLPSAVRRGVFQMLVAVGPACVIGIVLAPFALRTFGPGYAAEGTVALAVLLGSTVLVAPTSLYLAVLRSRERTLPLAAWPLATLALLLLLAPPLEARLGLEGVAVAWASANLPGGLWAMSRLYHEGREVNPHAADAVRGRPHVE